jgi:hypothetical protein
VGAAALFHQAPKKANFLTRCEGYGMTRKASFISLSFLLVLAGGSWAGIDIPEIYRIKNQPPGRCGWCSLETLGRYHQLKVLYELSEHNASRCTVEGLQAVLVKLGIPHRIQLPGEYGQDILRHAVREGLGAVVGFRELFPGAGGHAVTLVDFGDDVVRVIDSNDQDGRIREMTPACFLYWWDGFALVIEPKVPRSDGKLAGKSSLSPSITPPGPTATQRPLTASEGGPVPTH